MRQVVDTGKNLTPLSVEEIARIRYLAAELTGIALDDRDRDFPNHRVARLSGKHSLKTLLDEVASGYLFATTYTGFFRSVNILAADVNRAALWLPSERFDAIFCRNVLMYRTTVLAPAGVANHFFTREGPGVHRLRQNQDGKSQSSAGLMSKGRNGRAAR